MHRSFLFLQGPCTPFFSQLAQRLKKDGHAVHRINFSSGDTLYWQHPSALHFREKEDFFKTYLEETYRDFGISDQVLFGDRRAFHKIAIEVAKMYGIRTHVFEEGYFRPFWITLEREGVNAHSLLPRDPQWYKEASLHLSEPEHTERFHSSFRIRAMHDVVYHVAGMLNPLLYPHYRTHAPVIAPIEYLGYMKRFSLLRMIKKREHKRIDALITSKQPYFVLPLQLNSDAQIRDHSPFSHMGEVIEYVGASFAKHASSDAHLVIKNHPLDMGFMPYRKMIQACARHYGLEGRMHFFDDGNLTLLFQHASGVVTVNSTSGLVSLEYGIPTIALSDPIYNMQGLTFQSDLDTFWREPTPPHSEFFTHFRKVVMHATQINGGFYCSKGIDLAVENASRVLVANTSPLEMLL